MNEPHPDSLRGRLQEWRLQIVVANLRRELNATPVKDPKFNGLRNDIADLLKKIEIAREADKVVMHEFAAQFQLRKLSPEIDGLSFQDYYFSTAMSESLEKRHHRFLLEKITDKEQLSAMLEYFDVVTGYAQHQVPYQVTKAINGLRQRLTELP